jgi:hypothetical protein
VKNLHKVAYWILFDFRASVGMWLLSRALDWMPRSFSLSEGVARGVVEQTEYDRYAGYTTICGASPWPFERWREERKYLRAVRARPCKVRDTSHIYTLRETAL